MIFLTFANFFNGFFLDISLKECVDSPPGSHSLNMINKFLFDILFQQILQHAIEQSKVDGVADYELAFYKVERAGFVAGQQLLDKLFPDVERRRQVGRNHLECLKYLCKEVWQNAFGKMMDNLKTNRKETFVMIDADFSWIKIFGEDARSQEITQLVILYLAFPCGLLRGAFTGFGLIAAVTAEIPAFPQCSFQVHLTANEGDMQMPSSTIE